jgi:hypothetical protein
MRLGLLYTDRYTFRYDVAHDSRSGFISTWLPLPGLHQVPKRMLYQHFPSKAAVVEECLRCIQQGAQDGQGTHRRSGGPMTELVPPAATSGFGWTVQ